MTLDLKKKIQADLTKVEKALGRAYVTAQKANDTVSELERERDALQSALDIMEGKQRPAPEPIEKFGWPNPAPTGWTPAAAPPDGAQYVDIGGETVLLEKGFEVRTNSFGEQSIVPVGFEAVPMAEPTIPTTKPPLLLPPIGNDEGFASEMPTLEQS